jgi:hypothetical protein
VASSAEAPPCRKVANPCIMMENDEFAMGKSRDFPSSYAKIWYKYLNVYFELSTQKQFCADPIADFQ